MRRKQGRLKPGGQYLSPTRTDTNSADKVTSTGDKDTSTGDKDTNARDNDSNMKNKYAKERDESAENKDASSLTKASSAEDGSSGVDKRERGRTRNMKKTDQAEDKQDLLREGTDSSKNEETGTNMTSPSEQPQVLPQVCIGDILYLSSILLWVFMLIFIQRPSLFRPFVGLVVVLETPVTWSHFSSNLSVQSAGDQR